MMRPTLLRRRAPRATVAAALILAAACDDAPPTDVPPPEIELTIVSPAQGSALTQTRAVLLLATATAQDVGPLPDDSVQWSIDGEPLAPGRSHTLRLAPGEHVLEVAAHYGSRMATRSRTVSVDGAPVGTVLWRSDLGAWDWGGLSAGEDGTLYVQESDSELLLLGPDGTLRGRRTGLRFSLGEHPPTVLPDGSVILGTYGGVLALTPDGLVRWEYRAIDMGAGPYSHVHGGVAVGTDGTVYFGTEDYEGIVVALWPDGSERWVTMVVDSVPTPTLDRWRFFGAPVLVGDSLVVLVEASGRGLVGLDARTGEVSWRWESGRIGGNSAQLLAAVAANGDVIAALKLDLVRIDPGGGVVWRTALPVSTLFPSYPNAPAIGNNRIYVPTGPGVIVYGPDGTRITTFGSGHVRGAVTIGRNGVLYVVGGGSLSSFAPDGTLRYEVPVRGSGSFFAPSGPVLAPDGTVFAHSGGDGGVIAIADTVGPSPDAEWPTTGGGFGRLGRRH